MLWSGCFAASVLNISRRFNPFTWFNCKLILFLGIFSSQWSSWLLTVMSIEKFFALYFPLKTRSICTVVMAKRVTFFVTLILMAANVQHLFVWEVDVLPNGFRYCLMNVPEPYISRIVRINYALYSLAPFTIMVLINGMIIYKFMRTSCVRDQGGTESTNQALSKSANRGTAMLITVSLAFLILTGPVAITYVIVTVTIDSVGDAVITTMRYSNNSINAVLYCVSGSRFRNELMNILPFRLFMQNTNNCGSQSVSSLTGKSSNMTVTYNASVTASPI